MRPKEFLIKEIPCLPFFQVDFFQRINRLLLWQGSVISRITQRKITWHNVAFRRTDLAGCKLPFFSRGNPDCTSKPFCRCSQQNIFNTAPHSGKPIQRLKGAWPQQIAILFINGKMKQPLWEAYDIAMERRPDTCCAGSHPAGERPEPTFAAVLFPQLAPVQLRLTACCGALQTPIREDDCW